MLEGKRYRNRLPKGVVVDFVVVIVVVGFFVLEQVEVARDWFIYIVGCWFVCFAYSSHLSTIRFVFLYFSPDDETRDGG